MHKLSRIKVEKKRGKKIYSLQGRSRRGSLYTWDYIEVEQDGLDPLGEKTEFAKKIQEILDSR